MPEAAITHDGDRAALLKWRHAGNRGQAHAVTEDRIALRERLEGAEGMTADVGTNMQTAHVGLYQLHGGEHRALGAADTKSRRARRDGTGQGSCMRCAVQIPKRGLRRGARGGNITQRCITRAVQKARYATQNGFGVVFAGTLQHILAVNPGLQVRAVHQRCNLLLDVLGLAFFHHQHL